MMLTLIALVAVLVIAVSIVLIMRYQPPSKDQAAILYDRFTRAAGTPPQRGETPQSYALRLSGQRPKDEQNVLRVTARYLAARYGPPDDKALRELRTAINQFGA
jgi:hypothetical protein